MYDNYNYPLGADGPDAPWNQSSDEQSPVDIDVCISQTFHKTTTVQVTDYTADEWEDAEYDEDGHICRCGGADYDFSDCNLEKAVEEQVYTIEDILKELPKVYEKIVSQCDKSIVHKYFGDLRKLVIACGDWELDESEIIKEE